MRHYRMMILAVLLTMVGRTMADNLTVETVKMSAGETKQVAIVLNNPTHQYAAFQFDMVLPEGVSIAKNDKGKFIASLNEDRKDDHTLNVSETGTNTYRFLAFSMTNTEFYGTDGALVYVTLLASEGISEGSKTATIQSQVFTEVSGEQYKWSDKTFTVEINGGGGSGQPDTPVAGDDMLTVEAISMAAGDTKQMTIGLKNPTHQYAAFQFDLVLPEGVSIAKNDKGKFIASLNEDRKDDHTLTVSEIGTNTYRFLTFSMTNAEFYGKDGALVYVTLKAADGIGEGSKTATIQSQVFTEVSGEQYKWPDKTFQITIEAAEVPVTLTAKSYTREYGDANPTFEYTVSGGTIISGSPTITCSATVTSPVGTYDIVIAKGTVSNGTVNLVKGTLTITKAPLTISAGNYTKKEGEDNPAFKATYSGFKNNETETVLTKKPTITTTATKTSAAGEYPVTVSGAEAQNYDISYKNGTLTVLANVVTLTAKSYTREYGDANPTFEYTVSGGTIISGSPTITCSATVTSPVGTYDIVIAKGTVSNGTVNLVKGTLTITKAPLTISAGNYTKKEGEDNPAFKATYSGFKNNETETVLTKKPTITTTATKTSAAGEYPVTVSGAEAQNYDISYKNGTLTVTECPSYTLTYLVDGTVYKSYQIKEGATITPEPAPTKEGYTFSGWSKIPETMPDHDVTVIGTMIVNKYKLTYMVDDNVYKVVEYEYGATITPEPQPEGDYATFEWVGVPETMPAHDVTVTASYVTGIIEMRRQQAEQRVYNTRGVAQGKTKKGLNIVVNSDGTVKKVVIK